MITMKDASPTGYPNRQQMLALIQARTAVAEGGADERPSAASDTPNPIPTCVPLPLAAEGIVLD